MLLQTVKSRNLWLWGETVKPADATSEAKQVKTNIQKLEAYKSKLSQQIVQNNKEAAEGEYTIDNTYEQSLIANINKNLKQDRKKLNTIAKSGNIISNNITYKRTFTDPFMITALQNVSFDWDNPIGESYGIKTNFLQAWHNKPVNIMVSGLSYIGAYGGKTVGTLSQKDDATGAFGLNLGVNTAIEGTISQLNKMSSDYLSKTSNAYETIVDDDIYKINKLMSLYGEGIYTSAGSDVSSSWIHLLLENDPGGQESDDQYVAFIGHIKKFTYKEDVSKPFLYQFEFTFVGEPAITKNINEAQIHAEQDRNSLKLTVVASDTGYSLGYGF